MFLQLPLFSDLRHLSAHLLPPRHVGGCSASGEAPSGVSSGSGSTGSGSGSTGSGSGGSIGSGSGSTGSGSTGSGGTGVIIEMPDGGNSCGAALPAVFRDFKGFGEPGGHGDFEVTARGVYFY